MNFRYLVYSFIIGFFTCLAVILYYLNKRPIYKEIKVPVKIKQIRKEVKIISDTLKEKELKEKIRELRAKIDSILQEKQKFKWQEWTYSDYFFVNVNKQNLTARLDVRIKYFGLLKEFDYDIQQIDTTANIIVKVPQQNSFKNLLIFSAGVLSGLIAYKLYNYIHH